MHHSTDRITHTTAFVTPVVEHWLEREIAQWDQTNNATRQSCRNNNKQSWYPNFRSMVTSV